jgi:hypothetical protein
MSLNQVPAVRRAFGTAQSWRISAIFDGFVAGQHGASANIKESQ